MGAISDLSQGAVTAASQLPFYDPNEGGDFRAPVSDLAPILRDMLTPAGEFATQYASPAATGFSVAIAPPVVGDSVWLLLTPAAIYATGTITLPAKADCRDGQEVLISCTQAVTTLTVAGNGATINGGPTTLAANGYARMRFDGVFQAWFRTG